MVFELSIVYDFKTGYEGVCHTVVFALRVVFW